MEILGGNIGGWDIDLKDIVWGDVRSFTVKGDEIPFGSRILAYWALRSFHLDQWGDGDGILPPWNGKPRPCPVLDQYNVPSQHLIEAI